MQAVRQIIFQEDKEKLLFQRKLISTRVNWLHEGTLWGTPYDRAMFYRQRWAGVFTWRELLKVLTQNHICGFIFKSKNTGVRSLVHLPSLMAQWSCNDSFSFWFLTQRLLIVRLHSKCHLLLLDELLLHQITVLYSCFSHACDTPRSKTWQMNGFLQLVIDIAVPLETSTWLMCPPTLLTSNCSQYSPTSLL